MSMLHIDLQAVLDAVEIESPARFRVRGVPIDITETASTQSSLDSGANPLVASLAREIYERLYTRPPAGLFRAAPDEADSRDLRDALSTANNGRGTWEPGWIVARFDEDGRTVAARNGVLFWVPSADLRTDGGVPRPGGDCRVKVPKERRNQLPGYYLALGNADFEIGNQHGDEPPGLRYYWHLTERIAVPFVNATTSLLNAHDVPFQLKVLADARAYHRADAGVLYVNPRDQSRIGPMIAEIYAKVARGLRPGVPMFTMRLADGLGFAEDPDSSHSFGQHRCDLVALGLWQSYRVGDSSRAARAATLAATFVEAGLDPLRPHLGPGSRIESASAGLPATAFLMAISGTPQADELSATSRTLAPATLFLEAATQIGSMLCRSAFWDRAGRLCNWIGCTSGDVTSAPGTVAVKAEAIGHDVYQGSSGVALFLTRLWEATGDSELSRTACGAIHRSLRQLGSAHPTRHSSPLSFYCGDLGVAYVAERIGRATSDPHLIAAAHLILGHLADSIAQPHELDVIGGNAGAIPILLGLARNPGLEHCRQLAVTLGEELCQSAVSQNVGCGWPQDAQSAAGNSAVALTGLSHGAAGFGMALFELHAATESREFLEAARSALAYEDSLFDCRERNWPDLRTGNGEAQFARAWCHGAPGIALARLRAAVLDPDRADEYLTKAQLALATTIDGIDQLLGSPACDTSLCHGSCGLGEIMLIAGELLGDPAYHDRAVSLGRLLIERHMASGDWPSGVPSRGPNPSLMLGLAGAGYWYLRLRDPKALPSVLLSVP